MPEHLGFERRDAAGASDLGQPLEKARPDALALKSVFDGEGDLGAVRPTGQPEVMRDRHDAPGRLADEGEHTVVVHAAESGGPLRVDLRQREEPEVQAVGGEPLVEGQQRRGVLRANGPQAQRRSRAQDDVPFLFARVRGFPGLRGRDASFAGVPPGQALAGEPKPPDASES